MNSISKRILSVLLVVVMCLTTLPATAFAAATERTVNITGADGNTKSVTLKDADGDGYYDIGTADELYAFAAAVNGGNGSINGELTADIDLESRAWTPITNFSGTFDGAGYEIKNFAMNITAKGDHGLFGFVKNATVKDFTIYGEVESKLTAKPDEFNYGVIGEAQGSTIITDVHSHVNLTINDNYYRNFIGGIIGSNNQAGENFAIERCSFSGKLNLGAAQVDCTGGIIAYVMAGHTIKIDNCLFDGEIISTYNGGPMQIGGLMGYYRVSGLTITNSLSVGDITVNNNTKMGEIVGILRQHGSANQMVTNNYYLEGKQPFGNSTDSDDITDGYGSQTVAGSATAVTEAQLKSGEIAYKLGSAWGQTIETDETPVLGGAKVYYGYTSCAEDAVAGYTNDANASPEKPDHDWKDGVCQNGCEDTHSPHTGGTATYNGDGTHKVTCSDCGETVTEREACSVDLATGKCVTCGTQFQASLTMSGVTTYYENVRNAISAARKSTDKSTRLTLLDDLNSMGLMVLISGGTFTLDLNGHSIQNSGSDAAVKIDGANVEITGDGTLKGYYSVSANNGSVLISGGTYQATGITINYSKAAVTITGGTFEGRSVVFYNNLDGNKDLPVLSGGTFPKGIVIGLDIPVPISDLLAPGYCYWQDGSVLVTGNATSITGSVTVVQCDHSEGLEDASYTGNGDGTHNKSCATCGTAVVENEACSGGTATCTEKAVCTVCGNRYGEEPAGHTAEPTYAPNAEDSTKHDVTYDCCNDIVTEAHSMSSTTGKCVCGAVCAHSGYDNGFCDNCDAYEPAALNENGYYEIGNAGQLYWFSGLVNGALYDVEQNVSANAVLLNDITLNEHLFDSDGNLVSNTDALNEWIPIGFGFTYSGIFDGQDHTVSGLYYSNTETYNVGLFGRSNGTIRNITVENSYLRGGKFIGGIVGWNDGSVYNCASVGCVIDAAAGLAGGIAGIINGGIIDNCYNASTISGAERVGGICGDLESNGSITNCYNTGAVTSTGNNVGGIAGFNGYDGISTIKDCYNTGSVSGQKKVGGISGCLQYGGTVTNCYNTGTVKGTSYFGGIIGIIPNSDTSANCKVESCYFNSDVFAGSGVGYIGNYGTVNFVEGKTTKQFASGEVTYRLNGSKSDGELVWYQTIRTDSIPKFAGGTVYKVSCEDAEYYSNEIKNYETHNFVDGICSQCGEYDTYEISNVDQYVWFAEFVNAGNTAANAKLMADIDLSEHGNVMIGTSSAKYSGRFDGNGKKLTVNFNTTEEYVAPFRYINGATIQNLTVDGTIATNAKFAAGLVGYSDGTSKIEKCMVGVTINSGVSGDGTHGGLVANVSSGSMTIDNCGFIGSITGDATDSCGGFVGWANGKVTIKNSYICGTFTTGTSECNTFGRNAKNITVSNSYYKEAYGTDNTGATQKSADQFASGEVTYLLNGYKSHGELVWYQTLGSDAYPSFAGETVYWVNICGGDPVYTNEKEYDTGHQYENGICSLNGCYMPATLVDESNRADFGFTDATYDGYWAIGNLGQLMWFADNVASAKHSAILTADITIDNSVVWTPITLNDAGAISSIFDGGGHTVTFANTNEGSTFGLFGSYNYSIIENLYLAGSITCNTTDNVGALVNSAYRTTIRNVISTCCITNTESSGGVGGLAGQFGGQDADGLYSLIENCAVYADIMGGGSAGGLIGNIWGGKQYCTVRNCAYVGNVAGGTNSGAIVGHNGNNSSTTSTLSNIYFCETDGIGWIGSVGSGKTSLTNLEAKTADQFASGEVAYLMQGEQESHVWGQTCGEGLPTLGGAKVYWVTDCKGNPAYSNTETVGHVEVIITGKAPTCTEPGLTDGVKCSLCGVIITQQKEIPTTDHKYEDGKCGLCGEADPDAPALPTVYFINSDKWDRVNAYVFDDDGSFTWWPGALMTKTEQTVNGFDVYEIALDRIYAYVIFNNGSSQTSDLEFKDGQYYDPMSGNWYESLDDVPGLGIDCYLLGAFNDWNATANEFKLNAVGSTTGYVSLELEANTTYEFKIVRQGAWTSCATAITGTVEGLRFSSSTMDNATITTTAAGTYVFAFDLGNSCLSVTYPVSDCDHNYTVKIQDPTCQEGGVKTYTCRECGDVYTEDIPATDHKYITTVVRPTCETEGYTIINCANCIYRYNTDLVYPIGHDFKNGRCDLCGQQFTIGVDFWNVSLGGDIRVNFLLKLASEDAAVEITVDGEAFRFTASDMSMEGDLYKATVAIAAAQMTQPITVKILEGGETKFTETYTVRQYCDTILANEFYSWYHTLVKEMLNYGGAAQAYFDYDAENLANDGITGVAAQNVPETTDELVISDSISGLNFYGASLVYRDRIAVRYYFTGDITGCTFTANGNTYTPVAKDGMHYVEIADILPQDLDQQITLTVTDANGNALSATYGPMNYIVRMNEKGSAALQNLVKALYNYHLAAKALQETV